MSARPVLRRQPAGAAGSAVHLPAAGDLAPSRRTGCRVLVPFGKRTVAGVVLRTHNEPPAAAPREALRLARRGAGAGRRPAQAGPLDLRILLRAAGRNSARDDAAGGRYPPRQGLLADLLGPRRGAPVSFRRRVARSGGGAAAACWTPARSPALIWRARSKRPRPFSARWRRKDWWRSEDRTGARRHRAAPQRSSACSQTCRGQPAAPIAPAGSRMR